MHQLHPKYKDASTSTIPIVLLRHLCMTLAEAESSADEPTGLSVVTHDGERKPAIDNAQQ